MGWIVLAKQMKYATIRLCDTDTEVCTSRRGLKYGNWKKGGRWATAAFNVVKANRIEVENKKDYNVICEIVASGVDLETWKIIA